MKYGMWDATTAQANNYHGKQYNYNLGNRWLGADGLPSVVGSTSPSRKWSESIREIKNRHYNLPKATQQLPKQISLKYFKTSAIG